MIVSVLLFYIAGVTAFIGTLLYYNVADVPWFKPWAYGTYAAAIALAICGVFRLLFIGFRFFHRVHCTGGRTQPPKRKKHKLKRR